MRTAQHVLVVALAVALTASVTHAAPERPATPQVTLSRGDHLCVIGGTVAERFQLFGWLETLLHSRFPEHQLVVRNLAYSGDEITLRLRSKNFGTPDEWLAGSAEPIGGYNHNRLEHTNTRADVIFAFFGYNESFAGDGGLRQFKADLDAFVKHTLSQKYNGNTAPRLVLFSPIAHENLKDANLPDGSANNARIERYTAAMAQVAAANGVGFVDLFHPTLAAYASANKPWTLNGVHQNELGDREIARIIDRGLFGDAPSRDAASLQKLRHAVLDKSFHWYNRYRTTDGYSTYGDRAFLVFHESSVRQVKPDAKLDKAGFLPMNYDTMQRELHVLDIMTANRDRRIWAVARGGDLNIDDANTPPFIDARTNKPGTGPGGKHEFLSGEQAISHMQVHPGLKVNLFASEEQFPELINPVQMAWDTRGRLWVAVWPNYPHWQPKSPMNDKLLILEDTNGDGKADKCTVFADDLHNPTGFEFYNGGVIVAVGPNILFLKDSDGDDKADVKVTMLHGLDTADTHHTANSFTFDPGGALYFQEGTFHHSQVESPWAAPARVANGAVFRFEPRTYKFDVYVSYGFANPHGHVFDRWGADIVIDGTGAVPYYAPSFSGRINFPDKHERGAPTVYKQRTRPCPGAEVLTSRHFPDNWQGNLLVPNVIGFQGILNYKLDASGAGLAATEAEPILQSDDPNFRPADVEMGPDGAIYFTDWQNPVIGHMQHNMRDTSRDKTHGRVYRVTFAGRPLLKPATIAGASIDHLLDLLKSPENRTRYQAKIELSARPTADVMAALESWITRLDKTHADYEHHITEALWVRQWHNVVDEPLLRRNLRSGDHRARAAATRVLCYWRDRVANPLALLSVQADDEHPRVRIEAVRTASFFPEPRAAEVALRTLRHDNDAFLMYCLSETMKTLEPHWKQAIAAGRPFSADNPAGIDYILRSVAATDLLKLPRTPTVYQALLTRAGILAPFRQEAIDGLARINKTDAVTELLAALAAVDRMGADGDAALGDLRAMLVTRPAAELKAARDAIARLAASATRALTRQAAYVATITADASVDPVWSQASVSLDRLGDVLLAIPLVPDAALRASAHGRIRPLIARGDTSNPSAAAAVRRAAIAAIVSTRVDSAGVFSTLAKLVDEPQVRAAAISALSRMPRPQWPREQAGPLAHSLIAYLAKLPPARRTTDDAKEAISLATEAAGLLPADEARTLRRKLRDLGVTVVVFRPIREQMLFDRNHFAVQAGKGVEIVLDNTDVMPHNLVITAPGAIEKVGTAGDMMAADPNAFALHFVPRLPEVLFATKLVQPQAVDRISFTAPTQPGEYPFVCTFPGHWRRMYGVMTVAPDIEAYENSPVTPKDPFTGKPLEAPKPLGATHEHKH